MSSRVIGTTVSHYRIIDKLGGGGMGVVYKAEDTKLRRTVALKFLPPELTRDEVTRARFVQEARAASALDHPNICTIYEIDETPDGQSFIAMAYYDGETLKKKIERGPLPFDQAIEVACQISEGLIRAHARGIIHRDIKPANIMVTSEGNAKILDFGLAKLPEVTGLTQPGFIYGTAGYMSPEQARGDAVDWRTDVWALGVVLYEMLSGKPAFRGESAQAVIYSILHNPPEPLSTSSCASSPDLWRIASRALAKQPTDRYASTQQLLDDLRRLQRELELRKTQTADAGRLPSIAVLPFSDMSPQRDQDYFCEGIAEELINTLAGLKEVRVASRTSSFQFRGQTQDIRHIGERLNVETILEGSVRKAGNRIRVTAQLINCYDGYHLWSERYDRDLDDIFAVQDEITRSIVEKLKVRFVGEQGEPLVRRQTEDIEAYNLYLRGRYYWSRRYSGFLQKAVECFEQAVAQDPSYALAYAGVADGYALLGIYGLFAPRLAAGKGRAAARRAVELDETLAEAHRALALILFCFDWDWSGAEREYRRALELDPKAGLANAQFGLNLAFAARQEEASLFIARGLELEPLSPLVGYYAATAFLWARQFEKAVAESDRTLDLDPHFALSFYTKAWALIGLSRIDEAVITAEQGARVSARLPHLLSVLASSYALAGRTDQARQVLDEFETRMDPSFVDPGLLAGIYAAFKDAERTLEYLEKGCEIGVSWTIAANAHFVFDFVRDDPRFAECLRRMNFG